LAIQIFDQKKFKKKDQGFLGVINIRIGDVIDLEMGGDGMLLLLDDTRMKGTDKQQRCSPGILRSPPTTWSCTAN
jgi:hypothetical protein